MDEADYANLFEENERDYRRALVADALPNPKWGTTQCVDCGEDITPARRQAMPGVCTCVDCQQLRELNRRRYRAGARPGVA